MNAPVKKRVTFSTKNQIRVFTPNTTRDNFYLERNTRRAPSTASNSNFFKQYNRNGRVTQRIYAPEFYNLENGLRLFETKIFEKNRRNLYNQLVKKYPSNMDQIRINLAFAKSLMKNLTTDQEKKRLLRHMYDLQNAQRQLQLLELRKLQNLRNRKRALEMNRRLR